MVGVQMAALAPNRVVSLVLINSPLDSWRGMQRIEMVALTALLKILGPKGATPLLVPNMLSKTTRTTHPERAMIIREMFRSLDRTNIGRAARSAMLDRPSLLPILPSLELPVLVIVGSQDGLVPLERARAEAGRIPRSRFEVVNDTAHLSAYEAPDTVNDLVRPFLEQAARQSP
jgi:pimeloyl-ACP methyl ester carboxylesterase